MFKKDKVILHIGCQFLDKLYSRCTRREVIVQPNELACKCYKQKKE